MEQIPTTYMKIEATIELHFGWLDVLKMRLAGPELQRLMASRLGDQIRLQIRTTEDSERRMNKES